MKCNTESGWYNDNQAKETKKAEVSSDMKEIRELKTKVMKILRRKLLRNELSSGKSKKALNILRSQEMLVAKEYLRVLGVSTEGLTMAEMVALKKQAEEDGTYTEAKVSEVKKVEYESQVGLR